MGGLATRRAACILAATILVAGALGLASPASALDDHQSHEHGHPAEHNPDCEAAGGERHPSAVTVDPTQIDRALGTDLFAKDDKIPVAAEVPVRGEQAATFCSGENWDGQDPNTKESDKNREVQGDADEPMVDTQEGDVYVNPLYGGDCSGWNSGHHDGGCQGGTQRPTLAQVIHQRVTADGPGTEDREREVTVYQNGEGWGMGRESVAVRVDGNEDGDRSDRGGWVGIYLEDGSDQLAEAVFGPGNENQPLCANDLTEDCFDGNYLLIPFDPIQGGSGGEGDCTSHEYQDAQRGDPPEDNEEHEDHDHGCRTDSSSFTLGFGYAWLEVPGAAAEDPPVLP